MAISDIQYMQIAEIISKSSHCKRNKVGCILVKNDKIISIGYNGMPKGFDNCCEDQKRNTKNEVIHAESNAIAKCSSSNISSKGSILYCTLAPCIDCSKLIIQSGIKKVIFLNTYRDESGIILLQKSKIPVHQIIYENEF